MELPTGTVTLLFSDMEGSTRLLTRLGSQYAAALDEQRRILRAAWSAYDGVELGTEGDSFFVAFASAPAAVSAAVEAQRGLAAADWPAGERVLVRIGIHTGAPVRHGDGYVGLDVHRAARVMSAARGGQVLVTDATAALAHAAEVGFRDLGRHALKDLPQPEHLFQVTAPGLRSEFGPVRAMGSTANLPVPATPIVGREEAVEELTELLMQPHQRLVTLTGPGGTGKTRLATALAVAVADRFDNGVYFVALEAVTSADVMWTTIASALDVPPEGRLPPGLFEHIGHTSALLVLDNLEQVRDAHAVVRELIEAAQGIRVVATSREPLHLTGEQEYAVPPLDVPDTDTSGAEDATAVQLFVRSAQLVKPSFTLSPANRTAVLEICRRLDGLPLALELAAARLKLLSPQALLARLDQALDLASTDVGRAERHRTLRQTIAWSYDLLPQTEQRLFRCLSVFAGNADLAAVESVWGAVDATGGDVLDLLQRLVDASLVTVVETDDDEPRVGMLRTVAAFAAGELAASPDDQPAHEAAVAHYDQLMRTMEADRGPRWRERLTERLETEHQQYRACLTWLLDRLAEPRSGDGEAHERRLATALQMTFRLDLWLLQIRGYYAEGIQWAEAVVRAAGDRGGLRTAACLSVLASGNLMSGNEELASEQEEAAYRMLDDHAADADLTEGEADVMRFHVTTGYAQLLDSAGDHAGAAAVIARQSEETRDPVFRAVALGNLAMTAASQGLIEEGLRYAEEAERLADVVGDASLATRSKLHRAEAYRLLGRPAEADREFRELFPVMLASREPAMEVTFAESYAAVLVEHDRAADAALLLGAAGAMRLRIGLPRVEEEETDEALLAAQAASGDLWDERVAAGEGMTVEQAVRAVMGDAGGPAMPGTVH